MGRKMDIDLDINGKKVVGFMAALAKGSSGRATQLRFQETEGI